MKLKVMKLHPDAIVPTYAKAGDAGLDLTAISCTEEINESGVTLFVYGTGLGFEIPEGHVGLIFPRSSISNKALSLTNSVGVVDSGYRGEVKFKFSIDNNTIATDKRWYKIGERIGQLIVMPYPKIELELVNELNTTERGSNGYGSTGV